MLCQENQTSIWTFQRSMWPDHVNNVVSCECNERVFIYWWLQYHAFLIITYDSTFLRHINVHMTLLWRVLLPNRQSCRKGNAEECIFDYMVLHIECRFNKTNPFLLHTDCRDNDLIYLIAFWNTVWKGQTSKI